MFDRLTKNKIYYCIAGVLFNIYETTGDSWVAQLG